MTLFKSDRLLYFSPATSGGLADYARAQANALARLGLAVDLLSSDDFPAQTGDEFRLRTDLFGRSKSPALPGRIGHVRRVLSRYGRLAHIVGEEKYSHVLLGSYTESLAPFWAGPLQRQARSGVVWGAIVHDPVRDYVIGPVWWHRRSMAAAYTFLREAFVHEPILLDTARPMPALRTTVIPHGPFNFPASTTTREQTRLDLEIPGAAQVWLSFGHIRDGKNLDLVIHALAQFPNAFLVIAGKEQSSGQKPVSYYQNLARQSGVAARCRWVNRFITPGEVGGLFAASDLVLLTYSSDFRSASGVLNVAVSFRKPCLASSGQGNLQTMVSQYDLGIWVEPDREESLVAGLHRWQEKPPHPRWDDYARDNSWQRNAELVRDRMFSSVP